MLFYSPPQIKVYSIRKRHLQNKCERTSISTEQLPENPYLDMHLPVVASISFVNTMLKTELLVTNGCETASDARWSEVLTLYT
ncbi:hypothetical protein CEXT_298171 [Caerostris extrusa]|uniref:Uncharacterized protein n=1 Tax=Caerostris extrusa TaxID=172846 RepID=A0AAV4QLS4_CAEEX|nr:hypothetical protein CEXT_298171 [Caerostris extrusa]